MLNKKERQKMQIIEWVKKHPEKIEEYRQRSAKIYKERYHTDPEFHKIKIEQARNYARERYHKLRNSIIKFSGGKCVYCGCNVFEALEINHVNGGGSRELRGNSVARHAMKNRSKFYLEILNNKRKDIELVCRVCNSVHWLKLKGINGYKVTWEGKKN